MCLGVLAYAIKTVVDNIGVRRLSNNGGGESAPEDEASNPAAAGGGLKLGDAVEEL